VILPRSWKCTEHFRDGVRAIEGLATLGANDDGVEKGLLLGVVPCAVTRRSRRETSRGVVAQHPVDTCTAQSTVTIEDHFTFGSHYPTLKSLALHSAKRDWLLRAQLPIKSLRERILRWVKGVHYWWFRSVGW